MHSKQRFQTFGDAQAISRVRGRRRAEHDDDGLGAFDIGRILVGQPRERLA